MKPTTPPSTNHQADMHTEQQNPNGNEEKHKSQC